MNENADEIDRLRQENASMRKELSLPERSSGRPETLERLERENEMLKKQKSIFAECSALLDTEEGRREALFCLQFFRSIPLPLWTSTLDANISYWNEFAERTYQHSAKKALGKNFINLFVSEAEKEQAAEDLTSIIFGEEGAEHFNLCKDKDKLNRQVYLVTCCFPVFDPRHGEVVQAEISFDLRQLATLEAELSDMYVRFRKKEEEQRTLKLQREAVVIKNLVEELFNELRQYCSRERSKIQKRIEKNRELMEDKKSSEIEKRTHKMQMEEGQKVLELLDRWELATQQEIAVCSTVDEHKALKTKLWETTRKNV